MKKIVALTALLLSLAAPAAFAADGGFYLTLHGGGTLLDDIENEVDGQTFNFETEEGWLAGAAIGYDLRDTYPEIGTGRIELEVTRRENDLDEYEDADIAEAVSGKLEADSIMFNTVGEFRDAFPWIPYIGVGAGAARISLDKPETATTPGIDDEDTVFAYQGMIGVGVQVACRLYLDLGYRYFATLDPEFTDATGTRFDSEYATHNLTLGMRFDF